MLEMKNDIYNNICKLYYGEIPQKCELLSNASSSRSVQLRVPISQLSIFIDFVIEHGPYFNSKSMLDVKCYRHPIFNKDPWVK
jgi:hypothetical protein